MAPDEAMDICPTEIESPCCSPPPVERSSPELLDLERFLTRFLILFIFPAGCRVLKFVPTNRDRSVGFVMTHRQGAEILLL